MDSTNRRRSVGVAFVLVAGIVALFVLGTLMASYQASPVPFAQPSASGALPSAASAPPISASPAAPGASPATSAASSPGPSSSAAVPGGPTRAPTLVFATPPPGPGEPGSSIEIPPPID